MLTWKLDGAEFARCDSIPLADRAFRYGMALFETFRVDHGRPLFLPEHLESLRKSCIQVGFGVAPIPQSAIRGALGGMPASAANGIARLYVTAGEGEAVAGYNAPSRVFLLAEERSPVPAEKRAAGYDLAIEPQKHRPLFGGLKTANYWANMDAYARARRREKDEAVLFNEDGCVLSASLANLFIVRNGRLETPAAGSGARAGIVRAWVETCRSVHEYAIKAQDLVEAEEIFLTSSWVGVMPVRALEDRILPSRGVAQELQAEYEVRAAAP